jgi:hypothetical protein
MDRVVAYVGFRNDRHVSRKSEVTRIVTEPSAFIPNVTKAL